MIIASIISIVLMIYGTFGVFTGAFMDESKNKWFVISAVLSTYIGMLMSLCILTIGCIK